MEAPKHSLKVMEHVVVIGAGVIGLQTSLFLLEAGYKVTIIAQHFPGSHDPLYTSPWAGAQWRTHALPEQKERCKWDMETFHHWHDILQDEEKRGVKKEERAGFGEYPLHLYWDTPNSSPEIASTNADPSNLWWSTHVPSFQILRPPLLPPFSQVGVSFSSLTINVPQYLSYLLQRAESLGAKTITATLPDGLASALVAAEQLVHGQEPGGTSPVKAFVNATGLGALSLVPDPAVKPVRGQTVLVRGEANSISTRVSDPDPVTGDERISYVIPRKGAGLSVLGGTKAVGRWDVEPDKEVTKKILRWGRELAPELIGTDGEMEVVKVQVGFRPGRVGGARVEREEVTVGNVSEGNGKRVVVHCYGHEGAGYQASVGCARKVVSLVQ